MWKRFSVPQKFKVVDSKDINTQYGCCISLSFYQGHVFNTNKKGILLADYEGSMVSLHIYQICTAGKFLCSSTKTVNNFPLISDVIAR